MVIMIKFDLMLSTCALDYNGNTVMTEKHQRACVSCSYNVALYQMDYGYPRYISWDFPGIGTKVDAAFEAHGEKYSIYPISDPPHFYSRITFSKMTQNAQNLLLKSNH